MSKKDNELEKLLEAVNEDILLTEEGRELLDSKPVGWEFGSVSDDFMVDRDQPKTQDRESLDKDSS